MKHALVLLLFSLLTLGLTGCAGDDDSSDGSSNAGATSGSTSQDMGTGSGTEDTGTTAAEDTGSATTEDAATEADTSSTPMDTGAEPDTAEATDTSEPSDTAEPPDSSEPADTAEPDTAEPDTSEPDTSEPDTSEPDVSESEGACDNPSDEAALGAGQATLGDTITGCVFECFGQSTDCYAGCIQREVGLTDGCSGCFGDTIQCTLDNCALQCIDATSQSCATCQAENCDGDFEVCAGIAPMR